MSYQEIFKQELSKRGLAWCRGCLQYSASHKRGFVAHSDKKFVHYDSEIATRKTLHNGFHEIGHCVNDETGMRRFQREANAEKFATNLMRSLGISVPRIAVSRGKTYVKRMKRWGDSIKRGKR